MHALCDHAALQVMEIASAYLLHEISHWQGIALPDTSAGTSVDAGKCAWDPLDRPSIYKLCKSGILTLFQLHRSRPIRVYFAAEARTSP
jgi:hypothetical protein